MSDGRVEQIGTPFEIYNFPRTRFVASFVGTLNMLRGRGARSRRRAGSRSTARRSSAARGIPHAAAGETCDRWRCARRRGARGLDGAVDGRNRLAGTIEEVSFLGSVVRIRVRLQDNAISLDTFNNPGTAAARAGAPVVVTFAPEDLLVLDEAEPG